MIQENLTCRVVVVAVLSEVMVFSRHFAHVAERSVFGASEVNSQLQVQDALGVKSFIQFWNAKLGQQYRRAVPSGMSRGIARLWRCLAEIPHDASRLSTQGGQETGRCLGLGRRRRCRGQELQLGNYSQFGAAGTKFMRSSSPTRLSERAG